MKNKVNDVRVWNRKKITYKSIFECALPFKSFLFVDECLGQETNIVDMYLISLKLYAFAELTSVICIYILRPYSSPCSSFTTMRTGTYSNLNLSLVDTHCYVQVLVCLYQPTEATVCGTRRQTTLIIAVLHSANFTLSFCAAITDS